MPQGERTDGAAPVAGQQAAQAVAPVEAPEVGLSEAAADPRLDTEITLEQFKEQLRRIDKTLRALPATAQARPRRPCSGLWPSDVVEARSRMLGKARVCSNAERFVRSSSALGRRCERCPLALQRGTWGAATPPSARSRTALAA